jgi:hypothetical protein
VLQKPCSRSHKLDDHISRHACISLHVSNFDVLGLRFLFSIQQGFRKHSGIFDGRIPDAVFDYVRKGGEGNPSEFTLNKEGLRLDMMELPDSQPVVSFEP